MALQDKDIRKFEEVNRFSEKTADTTARIDDDSDVIVWDPDDGVIPVQNRSYEELAPAGSSLRHADLIVDEVPSFSARSGSGSAGSLKSASTAVEDLALEIDSMAFPKTQSGKSENSDDDFLSALDDDQVNLIDEIIDQSINQYDLVPVETIDFEDDGSEVDLFVEERLIESKPLWSDDDDFWIIDAEGFGVPPHELFAFISSGGTAAAYPAAAEIPADVSSVPEPDFDPVADEMAPVEEVARQEETAGELPYSDMPYVLKASEDEIFIDVAELIDPSAKSGTPKGGHGQELESIDDDLFHAESENSSFGGKDDENPIIIVEPQYLSDDAAVGEFRKIAVNDEPDRRTIETSNFSSASDAGKNADERRSPAAKEPDVKSRLPEDFTITHIDLNEAEIIAQEDIFLLSEEDLIVELEQIDLHPVENEISPVSKKTERTEYKSDSLKSVTYITPEESILDERLQSAVENEISASSALIIEEDVRDIRRKLEEYSDDTDSGGQLVDITDRVVLIEDETDVDRFMAGIPEGKREEMKRLLTYLDGLFEKLPEDVVKKFADSEYFDLYVKIMNDFGG